MTDRLTPVGSCGGAEAILFDVPVEIAHDDVFGDDLPPAASLDLM
jgi:hypothetical protein